jgi:hypothetical protein
LWQRKAFVINQSSVDHLNRDFNVGSNFNNYSIATYYPGCVHYRPIYLLKVSPHQTAIYSGKITVDCSAN